MIFFWVSFFLLPLKTSSESFSEVWAWWDSQAREPVYLSVQFDFEKKIKSRIKPIRLTGDFVFRRSQGEASILMNFYRRSSSKKQGPLDSRVLIGAEKFWTYLPDQEEEPLLEKVDLNKDKKLQGALHSLVLFYGLPLAELKKTFEVSLTETPSQNQNWSFQLVPRDEDERRRLEMIKLTLNKDEIKTAQFILARKESIKLIFKKISRRRVSDAQLILKVPKNTKIIEVGQEFESANLKDQ